jgi:hypothetical protein
MIDTGAPAGRRTMRFKTLGLIGGMLLAVGLVALFSAVEVSSRPQFCGSCHVMKPYYESWKESSHKNIACVECHIAPGVTAEIRKKYEALSMVAQYFTGLGTKPRAEVEDAACLKCHERMSRADVPQRDVRPPPHLTETGAACCAAPPAIRRSSRAVTSRSRPRPARSATSRDRSPTRTPAAASRATRSPSAW